MQKLYIPQNFHSEPTRHREVTHKLAQTANNWSMSIVQVPIIGTPYDNWCVIGYAISMATHNSMASHMR